MFFVYLGMQQKKISVAPHIQRFLKYHFGECYQFSRKDWFGPIIAGVLKKGYRTSLVKQGEATYTLQFSEDSLERLGRHIDWDNIIFINIAADKVFRTMLFGYMDLNRKLDKCTARQSMSEFLTEYGITEQEISFETLYKDYQRKRKFPKTSRENVLQQIEKKTSAQLYPNFGTTV